MNENFKFKPLSVLLLGLSLFLAAISGCAIVDQKVAMNYSPTCNSLGRQSGEIVVARAETAPYVRNSKGEWVVGSLNNVHGVHRADLLSDRNLGDWINEALQLELKQAGYSVSSKPTLPESAPLGVMISDIKAFMNVNRGTLTVDARQELRFNLDLFLNGVKTKSFVVASNNSRTFAMSASPEEQEQLMLSSLQDAMRKVIPEIIAISVNK